MQTRWFILSLLVSVDWLGSGRYFRSFLFKMENYLVKTTPQLRTAAQTLLESRASALTDHEQTGISKVLTADAVPFAVVRSISQHLKTASLEGSRVHELLAGGDLFFPPPPAKVRTKEYIARMEGLRAAAETRKYAEFVKDLTADQVCEGRGSE